MVTDAGLVIEAIVAAVDHRQAVPENPEYPKTDSDHITVLSSGPTVFQTVGHLARGASHKDGNHPVLGLAANDLRLWVVLVKLLESVEIEGADCDLGQHWM